MASLLFVGASNADNADATAKLCEAKMPTWHRSTNPRRVTQVINQYEDIVNNTEHGENIVRYFSLWATDEIKEMNEVVPVDRRKASAEIRRLQGCGEGLLEQK